MEMHRFQLVKKYLSYLITSRTRHDVHSPFIYHLIDKVIRNDRNNKPSFRKFESLREAMLASKAKIRLKDLGAGSYSNPGTERKIRRVAEHSLKSPKYARLIYRLVEYFQPSTIIELGTSLGITTLYIQAASPEKTVFTIEGSEEILKIASDNFKMAGAQDIKPILGNFDEAFPKLLDAIKVAGFVFFDGNHRKESTLRYFKMALEHINNDSVFVFDDIHWSDEMEKAWEEIKAHPSVTVTIDLFFLGLVFFRKELQKQDFIIRF